MHAHDIRVALIQFIDSLSVGHCVQNNHRVGTALIGEVEGGGGGGGTVILFIEFRPTWYHV